MRLLLIALLVSGSALARDPACGRNCDELLKRMAVDCRKAAKGAESHGGGKAEAQHAAEACQQSMKKLRVSCLKQCAAEQKKKH